MPHSRRIQIRAAEARDAPLIATLIHELAEFEREPEQCHATAEMVNHQLFARPDPVARAVIAELNGAPVGFALYFTIFSTWECTPGLYLEDLYVRPAFRGRGVGKALLTHCAQQAVAKGCHRLELLVLDWNQRAIDFYQAHGAHPVAGWTVHRIDGEALERLGAPVEEP